MHRLTLGPFSWKRMTHRKIRRQAAGAVAGVAWVVETRAELAGHHLEDVRLAVVGIALEDKMQC